MCGPFQDGQTLNDWFWRRWSEIILLVIITTLWLFRLPIVPIPVFIQATKWQNTECKMQIYTDCKKKFYSYQGEKFKCAKVSNGI